MLSKVFHFVFFQLPMLLLSSLFTEQFANVYISLQSYCRVHHIKIAVEESQLVSLRIADVVLSIIPDKIISNMDSLDEYFSLVDNERVSIILYNNQDRFISRNSFQWKAVSRKLRIVPFIELEKIILEIIEFKRKGYDPQQYQPCIPRTGYSAKLENTAQTLGFSKAELNQHKCTLFCI